MFYRVKMYPLIFPTKLFTQINVELNTNSTISYNNSSSFQKQLQLQMKKYGKV